MRRFAAFSALAATLLAGGCVTAPADGSPRVQTTGQANRENLEGAAKAPLRDLNLLRTKIPDVLLEAMADPYARPPDQKCLTLIAEIQPLNDALGADLDEAVINEDDLLARGKDTAYGAVAGLATDTIPFRGWVRKLSGAERHDKLVAAAVTAGGVRRAYLKGLGEAKGCKPPATPSHEFAGREVMTQDFRPRYPTRASEPESEPGTPAGTRPAAPRK